MPETRVPVGIPHRHPTTHPRKLFHSARCSATERKWVRDFIRKNELIFVKVPVDLVFTRSPLENHFFSNEPLCFPSVVVSTDVHKAVWEQISLTLV